jgi:hypothetical protein
MKIVVLIGLISALLLQTWSISVKLCAKRVGGGLKRYVLLTHLETITQEIAVIEVFSTMACKSRVTWEG